MNAKTCLVPMWASHSPADASREGQLTIVSPGPSSPGRTPTPEPPLPPDPSPFPGPPLPEPTPTPEPPPPPDPSPFPGPPPQYENRETALYWTSPQTSVTQCRCGAHIVSLVEMTQGLRWIEKSF